MKEISIFDGLAPDAKISPELIDAWECYVEDLCINAAQVESGLAVAYTRYSLQYEMIEAVAKKAKRGIWQGTFINPEEFRHTRAANVNRGNSYDK